MRAWGATAPPAQPAAHPAYTGRGSVCAVRVRGACAKKPPFLPPSVPTERANTTRLPPPSLPALERV
ncbi:hypothetical protein [Helicobacter bizzozeronii]|uniref:hypothetical protein n=1 Tax=Helicobacter bizzozeronii TaxID=56877 RepID=UPI000CEEDDFC|nr:hypothetical protein [Helicobacter bizzozeronii]